MSGGGNPLPVKEATLVLSLPERGIEPLARKAVLGADAIGTLATCRLRIPAAGTCASRH
jgi:copper transport protein